MRGLNILAESIFDKPIIAGYSLRSIFEYWWLGLIILIVAALAIVGTYFLLNWLFGRMKFQDPDKEALQNYKNANAKEKKEVAKQTEGPAKNVIKWKRMAPWFIPVVCVGALILSAAASFLPSAAFKNLLYTLDAREPIIYDTPASREAAAQAEKNVVVIQEEGTVLLKNDDILPLDPESETNINIFGSCAYGLFFNNGGSGSFQTDGRVKNFPRVAVKLEEALEEQGFNVNPNLTYLVKNYYRNKSISIAETDHQIFCGINTYGYEEVVPTGRNAILDPIDYELPVSAYEKTFDELGGISVLEDAKDFSDIALFAITRHGSEDQDMSYTNLKLSSAEEATIKMLKENFTKVIILLNIPTCMEAGFLDDPDIGAALYIGHPGLTGTRGIAEIIAGKVNPSGHLVDTWPYDVKSAPSFQNFGNDTTLKHTGASTGNFTEYLEGIYVGYRYYVTRAKEDPNFDYDEMVQYSFGHGLSYTTFDKSIAEFEVDMEEEKVYLTIEVKNTGSVPGKEVIQIYTHAPYYPGGIEKSYYSLSAFEKTNELQPGEAKGYKLEFSFREIASWSTEDGYYLLEHGQYEISLRENVWDVAKTETSYKNERTFDIDSDISFETSYQTGEEYKNIFQDVEYGAGNEPIEYLSREDFEGTWKNTSDIDRAAVSDKFPGGASNQTSYSNFTFQDNQIDEPQPSQGQSGSLTLRDLKDADWDDPDWENLLDQLSITDMENLVEFGGFQTASVTSIKKMASMDYDGPSAAFHSGTGHPSEVVLACSWSTDIAKLMGESIGREGAARGMSGWYAPGINTHRSPFGGRNFEYYSEDPFISGKMAGYTAKGTIKYGVYCYAKHFILNEQENSRAGLFVWAKEQAIREIYARGFEIYVDEGGIGIMSSFNCVGSWWAGASEALLTKLLRNEWGFHGVVVTDYAGSVYMPCNIGLRAGNDMWLTPRDLDSQYDPAAVYKATPNDATILFRRACKNILYACAHSNNVWELEDYQAVGIEEIKKAADSH